MMGLEHLVILPLKMPKPPPSAIDAVATGDENTTVQLSATVTGGTYDALAYAWSVDGGTLDDAAAVSSRLDPSCRLF